MASRPVLGPIPKAAERPRAGNIPPKRKWSFSLRYWRQIDNFGLGECQKNWFISILERLQSLGSIDYDDFMGDYSVQDSFRYHAIDWNATNIPIAKSDINWLEEYGNTDEFTLMQFSVSLGMGRFVGFFDENRVFQIVLFDPQHNLQPSKKFDYSVQATHIAECQLTSLMVRFERIITQSRFVDDDERTRALASMREQTELLTGAGILVQISQVHYEKLQSHTATGVAAHMGEVFEYAIDTLSE